MTDRLPTYTEIELELATLAGRLSTKLLKNGIALEDALVRSYPVAAEELKRAGKNSSEVDQALARQLQAVRTFPHGETAQLSQDLLASVMESFLTELSGEPNSAVRLDEKEVKEETGFRMFVYPNESKHAGFPHVTVQLQDGQINISLEDEPRVIAGKRNLRGEVAALKAVKEHRTALRKEWFAMRPDDQKIKKSS